MNRVTFVGIDQVRSNIKIEGPYAQQEQTVGTFKNFKAASSIAALNHNVSQWLFFSKKASITAADSMTGVDGWLMDVFTEKNKHAPSQYAITCVFDKITGISKFWSEYYFLGNHTPSESKLFKKGVKEFWPLVINTSGSYSQLVLPHPNTGEIVYESSKFYKKNAKELYDNDADFKKYFDAAVDISVHMRLKMGLFKITEPQEQSQETVEKSTTPEEA